MLQDEDIHDDNRWQIIVSIQSWFGRKEKFWLYLSTLFFGALFVLGTIFFSVLEVSNLTRTGIDLLVILALVSYSFTMFWRSMVQAFLTFVGALMMYFGIFFVYTPEIVKELSSPYMANRLGVGIKHYSTIDPTSIAEICFTIGMFALAFSLAISIKPAFFKPRKLV